MFDIFEMWYVWFGNIIYAKCCIGWKFYVLEEEENSYYIFHNQNCAYRWI
jgi:hypothetical protein